MSKIYDGSLSMHPDLEKMSVEECTRRQRAEWVKEGRSKEWIAEMEKQLDEIDEVHKRHEQERGM